MFPSAPSRSSGCCFRRSRRPAPRTPPARSHLQTEPFAIVQISSSSLARVAKFITDAAHSVEISRPRLFARLDAPPQPADEGVDAPHRHEPVPTPDLRQQAFAVEDDARVRGEDVEQLKLLFGELDGPILDPHVTPRRIDLDVAMSDRGSRGRRYRRDRRARARRPDAMDGGPRAGRELAGTERLHQEIVRAVFDLG